MATKPKKNKKPNILVIWGDDIGQFNVSAYNMGMMGYKTPNIDSIAEQGALRAEAMLRSAVSLEVRQAPMMAMPGERVQIVARVTKSVPPRPPIPVARCAACSLPRSISGSSSTLRNGQRPFTTACAPRCSSWPRCR